MVHQFQFERRPSFTSTSLGITANFLNHRTPAETSIPEGGFISYAQPAFFRRLRDAHIELENLVFYRDETNYFVMAAKRASLLQCGVLRAEQPTVEALLAPANVDATALYKYVQTAAVAYGLPEGAEVAINPSTLGPDVFLFDFTKKISVAEPSRCLPDLSGLWVMPIGDALMEPFWPQGTGCANGTDTTLNPAHKTAFNSALDAVWVCRRVADAVKRGATPDRAAVEREHADTFRRLHVSTAESMRRADTATVDPATRYPLS